MKALSVNTQNLILTKNSTEQKIKTYFLKIFELHKSDDEFPVDLDEVWGLVYTKKDNAFRELKKNFIEGVDYNLLQNEKVVNINNLKNGVKLVIKLTVSCLEYFIARKVRPVFEVYRQVFHQKSIVDFNDPDTFIQLAQNWKNEVEKRKEEERKNSLLLGKNEVLIKENKTLKPKAELMDKVLKADDKIDIGQAAKILNLPFGRNTLFKKLREKGIFFKNRNEPKQQYINKGYFFLKETFIDAKNMVVVKVLVSQKGLKFINDTFSLNLPNTQLALIK